MSKACTKTCVNTDPAHKQTPTQPSKEVKPQSKKAPPLSPPLTCFLPLFHTHSAVASPDVYSHFHFHSHCLTGRRNVCNTLYMLHTARGQCQKRARDRERERERGITRQFYVALMTALWPCILAFLNLFPYALFGIIWHLFVAHT